MVSAYVSSSLSKFLDSVILSHFLFASLQCSACVVLQKDFKIMMSSEPSAVLKQQPDILVSFLNWI